MIPWIQVYSNLPQHKKTSRLAEELKISSAVVDPNMVAVGILIGLWTWAIQNAYDGDLSECSARTIANACQWKKKPETLVAALKKTGWLDDDMRLHDWEEYAVLLIEQEENRKERTRERVRKHREKKLSGLTCAYCGSKAALQRLYETIDAEYYERGIKTTVIIPGRVQTPISLSALQADGKAHNVMDPGQKNGISAEKAAKKIVKAILRGRKEVLVGGFELAAAYIKRFIPCLSRAISRKVNN